MSWLVHAIETTGTVEASTCLRLDTPLPAGSPHRVRVIVLFPEEEYPESGETEWLRAGASNPAFDFLREPEENIYTIADGEPFDDQG